MKRKLILFFVIFLFIFPVVINFVHGECQCLWIYSDGMFTCTHMGPGAVGNPPQCTSPCYAVCQNTGTKNHGWDCGCICQCPSCTSETDSVFCTRLNKNCLFTGLDNCGTQRTVNCGTCPLGQTCSNGVCTNCVACTPVDSTQCSGTQIEQLCTSYGNGCTRWTSTDCDFGEACTNGQCQQVTEGLCSLYNTWKLFDRNITGGHNSCSIPDYSTCILNLGGTLFNHYCSAGNTIPIYRTTNISTKINLGTVGSVIKTD